jgi:transcriptional regulator with XRE-family HTH domain
MTIEALAAKADIHWTYVSRIENAKRKPTWDVVCRVATALEIDLGDLARLAAEQPASK